MYQCSCEARTHKQPTLIKNLLFYVFYGSWVNKLIWSPDLHELIYFLADSFTEHNERRDGHLHVTLLGVVRQRVLYDGVEEARQKAWLEEQL